jgi:hypothetical protein
MSTSNPSDPPAGFDLPAAGDAAAQWRMAEHWPELVVAVTDQAIESVDLLIRGLELMVQRGKLSPTEFQVLATPALRLKHCGMHAQQIVRFQSGQVRQSHEKIDLAYVVESVLQERRDELALQGITVRRKFTPTELLIDPTLGYSLSKAMLDWGVRLGQHVDLRLGLTDEDPPRGRLWLKVHTPASPPHAGVFLDSIQWLLLRQIAATDGGIEVSRDVVADGVELTAWFKRAMAPHLQSRSRPHPAEGSVSTLEQSVSGACVLVCSSSPDIRLKALGIVKQLGVRADGVASGAQAIAAMRNREVHLMVLDEEHPPADVAQLRFELAALHPHLLVLRLVTPHAKPKETGDGNAAAMSRKMRVPVNALEQSLGSAVMFALLNVL